MQRITLLLLINKSKLLVILLAFFGLSISLVLVNIHWETQSSKIKNRKIVLDPGHGGIDGGANDGKEFLEKDVNLKIGLFIKEQLEKEGSKVILTREEDISLDNLNQDSPSRHKRDLLARVQIINGNQPDVFISIHVNANKNKPGTDGPMVFYYRESEVGKELGRVVLNRLNKFTNTYDIQGALEPIGTKRFFVLRNTAGAGILIEIGFLSNQREKMLLQKDEYQRGLAHAIVSGVKDYFYNNG